MSGATRKHDQKIPDQRLEPAGLPEIFRSLAHDLRTPLASLQSCLNLVLSGETGDLTPDQQRFLGLARRNIDRLDRMVEGLLTAGPCSSGMIPSKRSPVDLGPILTEAVGLHRLVATDRGIEIDDSGLPRSFAARVDSDLVVRMLDNVLGNALKFTPSGGLVRVWLEHRTGLARCLAGRLARHWDLSVDTFNLIVEDNGPGLSSRVQDRLFEPYNRGPSETGQKASGTGLGLSVTRRLAESHGGQIRLISLPGQGTTVWLKLPRDPAAERFHQTCGRFAEALNLGSKNGVRPLVGLLDLRPATGTGSARIEGFFGQEASGFARAWEPAPGLWAAAVLDPVNWSRRWTLFAAYRGGGLENTRWVYLPGQPPEDSTTMWLDREQRETMVNSAPIGPNKK